MNSSRDNTNATGKAAMKFREPTWEELRGLTRRRASRDSGVLQADQCGNTVARRVSAGGACEFGVVASRCSPRRRPRFRVARAGQAPADTMAFYKALDLEAAGKYRRGGAAVSIRAAHIRRRERAARTRACLRGARLVRLARRAARFADRGEPEGRDVSHGAAAHAPDASGATRSCSARSTSGFTTCRRARRRTANTRSCLLQNNRAAAADSVMVARTAGARHDERSAARGRAGARGAGAVGRVGARVASRRCHRRLSRAGRVVRARADAVVGARRRFATSFSRCRSKSPARRALADLERSWGSPADGWNALKDLPPDSVAADGLVGLREARRGRGPMDARARSARVGAALEANAGARDSRGDRGDERRRRRCRASPRAARRCGRRLGARRARVSAVARHARCRPLGRPIEARAARRRATTASSRRARKNSLTRTIAWGWVRTGDMSRARAALAATGVEGDSSDAAGWLALYDGNLKAARGLLRGGTESSPELALALGLVARLKVDSAPAVGNAFLALAKGDSAGAAAQFVVGRRIHAGGPLVASRYRGADRSGVGERGPRRSRSGRGCSTRTRIRPKRRRPSSSGRASCAAKVDATGAATHLEH